MIKFPIKVKCRRVEFPDGSSYGNDVEFCGKWFMVYADSIKKHTYHKWPDITDVRYGVVCPVCGSFIPIETDLLPEEAKKNAPENKPEEERSQEETLLTFDFTITTNVSVQAASLTEAIKIFHEEHPEGDETDLQHVSRDGVQLPYVRSIHTGEQIYYMPGCVCGCDDCVLDPMRAIARKCYHQSEMTDDKYEKCEDYEYDDRCDCYNYDDECK